MQYPQSFTQFIFYLPCLSNGLISPSFSTLCDSGWVWALAIRQGFSFFHMHFNVYIWFTVHELILPVNAPHALSLKKIKRDLRGQNTSLCRCSTLILFKDFCWYTERSLHNYSKSKHNSYPRWKFLWPGNDPIGYCRGLPHSDPGPRIPPWFSILGP